MSATCTNPQCSQHDIAKALLIEMHDDDTVLCGDCGEPCELSAED